MNVGNLKTFSSESSQGSGKKQQENLKSTKNEGIPNKNFENSMQMTNSNIQKTQEDLRSKSSPNQKNTITSDVNVSFDGQRSIQEEDSVISSISSATYGSDSEAAKAKGKSNGSIEEIKDRDQENDGFTKVL